MLFIGLVWLRRANPLYRQHECKSQGLVSYPNELPVVLSYQATVTHYSNVPRGLGLGNDVVLVAVKASGGTGQMAFHISLPFLAIYRMTK